LSEETEGSYNALRKEVEHKQTEFANPASWCATLSSRHYNFKLKQWVFGKLGR